MNPITFGIYSCLSIHSLIYSFIHSFFHPFDNYGLNFCCVPTTVLGQPGVVLDSICFRFQNLKTVSDVKCSIRNNPYMWVHNGPVVISHPNISILSHCLKVPFWSLRSRSATVLVYNPYPMNRSAAVWQSLYQLDTCTWFYQIIQAPQIHSAPTLNCWYN